MRSEKIARFSSFRHFTPPRLRRGVVGNAVELSAGSGYLQGICYLKRSKKVADTLKVSATRAIKIP